MKLQADFLLWLETKKLIEAFGKDVDKLRFVGGAVRDGLLGIEVKDVDAATIFTPEQTTKILEKANIRAIPTGLKHGTITALIDGKSFEITTLRKDVACDGRHAQVEFTTNWQEDAARRDFTMNALYLGADGEIFDYCGGVEDTKAGIMRFIGDAKARITEDYLRILRFFRFFAYYGKGEIDKVGLIACKELAEKIDELSGERIQHEMFKLLSASAPFYVLKTMQENGILAQVFGFSISVTDAIQNCHTASPELRLAILLLSADISAAGALEIVVSRLRLSNETKRFLSVMIENINNIFPNLLIQKQKSLIRKIGVKEFTYLLYLKQSLEPNSNYDTMLDFTKNWQIPIFPVSGKDLLVLGIPEGKELGDKLHKLEILWEESDYKSTKEELLACVRCN